MYTVLLHFYVHTHTLVTVTQNPLTVTSAAHLDVELSQVGLSSSLVNGELLVVPAHTQEHTNTVCKYTHIAESTYKHTFKHMHTYVNISSTQSALTHMNTE